MDEYVKILLVDDHQIVLDGLKSLLSENTGFMVVSEALNGEQAIEIINANPQNFDLVITDISMPKLNGIELCSLIKKKYMHIKVIVLSMHNTIYNVKEALAAEADGYLLKNTGKEDFVHAIDRIMADGTYFSQDIMPIMMHQYLNAKRPNNHSILSHREKEILELIVQELTSKEIADKLNISKQTVDSHRNNIMAKTDCKSLVGLIKYAIQAGFVI